MLSDVRALKVDVEALLKPFATRAEVQEMIADEAARTRRYFDIMVERRGDLMKPLADGAAHHSTVLDNHGSYTDRCSNREHAAGAHERGAAEGMTEVGAVTTSVTCV